MWNFDKTIKATKTEFTFDIFKQHYDQTVDVSGSGRFDFGVITCESAYGDLRHVGRGIKN